MYKETKVQDLELQRNIDSNKEKARKGNRKKWIKNNQLFTQENRKYMKRCWNFWIISDLEFGRDT